jgi:outer membrane protein assembly factor BamE (lipoprotein component of BamABCDE complex)
MFFDSMAQVRPEEVRDCDHRPSQAGKKSIAARRKQTFAAKFVVASGLALGLCGCGSIYNGEVQHGYQLDQRSLDQIKVGSSAEQVLVVMGYPSTTSTIGSEAWYYISQKTDKPLSFVKAHVVDQHVLAIYFDKQKKVERVANYGMKDGQVFDFVSRTTPTGGAEGNFINGLFKNFMHFGG